MTKDYIRQYEDAKDATNNLKRRFKYAFTATFPSSQRKPNVIVDINTIFAEAKAESAIQVEGLETLAASTQAVGRRYRTRLQVSILL